MENGDLREILENIRFFIEVHDEIKLKTLLLGTHPADIVDIIVNLNEEESEIIFSLLPSEVASEVLADLDDFNRDQIIDDLEDERLAEIIDEMDSDDATDVVLDLPQEKAIKVLEEIDLQDSEEVRELLRYEEDTAGGIMALEFIFVNQNSTVDEAIEQIRRRAEEVDEVFYIFVVDDLQKLVGVLPVKKLIISNGKTPVSAIMNTEIISVTTDMDQEEVANIVKKYDLVAVPVVDETGKLVGRITVDDVMDVVDDEVSEDMHRLAGLTDDIEIHETSSFKISRVRLPWLLFGFMGGIASAVVMDYFEASLAQILTATFFIPIIMAMGGNAGIQSSTIMVRGLALGDIGLLHARQQIIKELRVSIINGFILGILLFLVIGFWFSNMAYPYRFGAVIGLSMFVIIINATIVGAVIPLFLKKINVDPAIATGPFITTTNDILGLLIYLGMATVYLTYLAR